MVVGHLLEAYPARIGRLMKVNVYLVGHDHAVEHKDRDNTQVLFEEHV